MLGPSLLATLALGCGADPIETEGEFGRAMALASGDQSPLPRLAFVDDGCSGLSGGCDASGDRACQMMLVDSLATLSAIRDPDATGSRIEAADCLEVRPAARLLAEDVSDEDRAAAVTRFRFRNLPLVRAPDQEGWSWTAGNQRQTVEPGGIMGGNLLRNFAVAIRTPVPPRPDEDPATVTLYTEFPGSEAILADQGRAFLPLQFPGSLLGRELTDRCLVDEGECEVDGFDFSTSANEIPLQSSRMVMDACVAIPPCGLAYAPSTDDPFGAGRCGLRSGPEAAISEVCTDATDPTLGGESASLVVATGVPGLVLFSDSATRMFGDPSTLEECPETLSPLTEVDSELRVCRIGTDDGVLHFAGWPSAGEDTPLTRLRVRSLALVPGATRSQADEPCLRAQDRRDALALQCVRYTRAASSGGDDIRTTSPPYSSQRDDDDGENHANDPSGTSLAVLGEGTLQPNASGPRPARWIPTTIMPADHPLVLALRRDVNPSALEPDGLLGTALLAGTDTVLDYTDLNPSLRVACLDPHEGRCQVMPICREDLRPACCHGLPRALLDEMIRTLDDDTCCGALSARDLAELQDAGHCVGASAP